MDNKSPFDRVIAWGDSYLDFVDIQNGQAGDAKRQEPALMLAAALCVWNSFQ